MIYLSHPTGNTFVRALLKVLHENGDLGLFFTTIAVNNDKQYLKLLPKSISNELSRRFYDIPNQKIRTRPIREFIRLLSSKLSVNFLTVHETGWASVDKIYVDLDDFVATQIFTETTSSLNSAVYCYEDGALSTFCAAKNLGMKCIYDLPIAYWKTGLQLLLDESERLPLWNGTLVGTKNSEEKLIRKSQELELADTIVCPSKFVFDSLPVEARKSKRCIISEFGSPELKFDTTRPKNYFNGKLRVLFAGSMSQRKGLADLFAAMMLLNRSDIELVVLGSPIDSMEFYRSQFPDFIYEPPRPHSEVLKLMCTCDVLVLPSIVEGRALVQQEAMSCGLPLIVTPNAGGEDLIIDGETGFLVPIRSPEALAEKINWFADNRSELPRMSHAAINKSSQYTWTNYGQKILHGLQHLDG